MPRSMQAKPLMRWQKAVAIPVIAIVAAGVALCLSWLPPTSGAARSIDTAIYDAFYKLRPAVSQLNSDIVIIAVDQSSIDRMAREANQYRWPWPRVYWGLVLDYLQRSGARVVAFDLLFEEPSAYNREANDDAEFAKVLDGLTMSVVHAINSSSAPQQGFAPPVKWPARFGAVDVIDDSVVRRYATFKASRSSLAVETVRAAGQTLPTWATEPFLLHYYGPSRRADGANTFRYLPAFDVISAAQSPTGSAGPISPADFKNKIVLIGATAAATFDLKSAPVAPIYPSVEAQATAVLNLLKNQRVSVAGRGIQIAITLFGTLLAAAGAVFPRRIIWKFLIAFGAIAAIFFGSVLRFTQPTNILWLPPTAALLGAILATVIGLAWTYLLEDRQRRVLLQFLSQYVSREVAAELERRGEISLGGQRREMTVMFTDIAGFTTLADQMPVETLERFMNAYLSEMSSVLFQYNATLDKYIGDAIMSFWNAPLGQSEHAELACHAALAMRRRENAFQAQFAQYGIKALRTRIGINTGAMVVGNVGSEQKVNYTVLGDAVNIASRLEGSNKLYGSSILVADSTVRKLKPDQFLFRKLDRLRVRGKTDAIEVYELLHELPADPQLQNLAQRFELALAHYFKREWTMAEQILVELNQQFPDDQPTQVLLERAQAFGKHPPDMDWNGVYDAAH